MTNTMEFIILNSLQNQSSSTGYDICNLPHLKYVWNASHQQYYRQLSIMSEKGEVTWEVEKQEHKPDKKLYSLTERGKHVYSEAKEKIKPSLGKPNSTHTVQLLCHNSEYMARLEKLSSKTLMDLVSQRDAMLKSPDKGFDHQVSILAIERLIALTQVENEFSEKALVLLQVNKEV
ncbi:PadR family transcriptional regulator (plasmid) [Vibrio nigripulchritudo]|uniref:PadR family transcriptional regulator n=1 Tax=Vibrio nigripulchritudo TaxID=28173 RepID=UPI001909BB0B|nr:PadR family transcriptional regulator [Vibrio nigripulchritudo]BCL73990.1 PadR family transcriptional regulator [Vibrio nigripulchritudo]BDU35367.1 PadR family transcriptional regulator [Vibrio nigripulchritudo]